MTKPGAPLAWIKANMGHSGDDCLLWPYEMHKRTGYGTLKHEGKRRPASRAMCIEAHGPPPSASHDAAHTCGNRACCNPRHIRWATRKENMQDAIAHGTWKRGIHDPQAKLTPEKVRQIRQRAKAEMQRVIAAEYGIDQAQVSRIVNRKDWAWVE